MTEHDKWMLKMSAGAAATAVCLLLFWGLGFVVARMAVGQ